MQPTTQLSDRELVEEIEQRARGLAMQEAQWLTLLAEFDRREAWRESGQLSAVDWLSFNCGMARVTAREKLRVAHELRRRPLISDAFAQGNLSYSKVRAMTRVVDADEQTDQWLLEVAKSGDASDLETVVRHFEQLRQQEQGIDDYMARYDRRGLRSSTTYDGMMVIEAVMPVEEGKELLANLEVAVDNDSAEAGITYPKKRLDALMKLIRVGRANVDGRSSSGNDRYMVHVVASLADLQNYRGGQTVDGQPVSAETLRRMTCDSAIVRHVMSSKGEPLNLGRRTSVWNTAQRRAIIVRDGGRCRWEGCRLKTCDVHHLVHWVDGGRTDLDNGALLCPRHHTLVHEGQIRLAESRFVSYPLVHLPEQAEVQTSKDLRCRSTA